MRIKLPHSPYIAHKIAIDLLKSGFVNLTRGVEPVAACAKEILDNDLQKEKALEERVNEVLAENEDDMESMQVDRKNMFWLVKKKLAKEYGVILTYELTRTALATSLTSCLKALGKRDSSTTRSPKTVSKTSSTARSKTI